MALLMAAAGCSLEATAHVGDRASSTQGAVLSDYAGSWRGYAQGHAFEDGSGRVGLTLDEHGRGVVRFGDAARPEPPVGPDAAYPAGYDWEIRGFPNLLPGFEFSVLEPVIDGRRLRLQANPRQIFATWCELQTPVPVGTPGEATYVCLPDAGIGAVCFPGDWSAECVQLQLCFGAGVCDCDSSGCKEARHGRAQLDVALEGNEAELVGTLLLVGVGSDPDREERIPVNLVRVEE